MIGSSYLSLVEHRICPLFLLLLDYYLLGVKLAPVGVPTRLSECLRPYRLLHRRGTMTHTTLSRRCARS
jgi:hypothetical protein